MQSKTCYKKIMVKNKKKIIFTRVNKTVIPRKQNVVFIHPYKNKTCKDFVFCSFLNGRHVLENV